VYVLRRNTETQIRQFLNALSRSRSESATDGPVRRALKEAEEAAELVSQGRPQAELSPQGAYVRRLQHEIAETHGLSSASAGRDPTRRVVIYRR
jgi:hypothetical protein